MKKYILTYARLVILAVHIEAEDMDDAETAASNLEDSGALGLGRVAALGESIVKRIEDYEHIWDIREVTWNE